MRENNFLAQKKIIKQIIKDIYPVSVEGNRIGIISYSDQAKVEVRFTDFFTETALNRSIDEIPFSGGGSRIDLALKLARDDLFLVARGARADAKKVCLCIFYTLGGIFHYPIIRECVPVLGGFLGNGI